MTTLFDTAKNASLVHTIRYENKAHNNDAHLGKRIHPPHDKMSKAMPDNSAIWKA